MTISEFSIHNVLRTYSKQYKIGKLVGGKKSSGSKTAVDAVEISQESKRMAFIKHLSADISNALEIKVPIADVEAKVNSNIDDIANEVAKDVSPDDEAFIAKLKEKLTELF